MMNWTGTSGPVTVTVANRKALFADLQNRMRNREGFTVATLNLDHVVKLSRDPGFHRAYRAQTHVTADGNPIVWLSRLSGQNDIELVPGSELVDPIAGLAAHNGVPIGLLGATDASLAAAAEELSGRHPGLNVVLTLAPPMGFDPTGPAAEAAIEAIRLSGARMVFLALGAPKQEVFAAQAQQSLPETGFVSIGAGLDFISGAQNRAPVWVRTLAAEWLWRLLGSPRRLAARYTACFLVLPRLTFRALVTRFQGRAVQ